MTTAFEYAAETTTASPWLFEIEVENSLLTNLIDNSNAIIEITSTGIQGPPGEQGEPGAPGAGNVVCVPVGTPGFEDQPDGTLWVEYIP